MENRSSKLLQLIDEKIIEAKTAKDEAHRAEGSVVRDKSSEAHRAEGSVVRDKSSEAHRAEGSVVRDKSSEAHRAKGSVVRDKSKSKRSQSPSTRAESNRQNAKKSTGPKSEAGKAKASANSLKHGFFANVKHLNPHDAPAYQQTHHDLRLGLQPDGPVEEQLIRELAMFSTRLQRLESAEYALLAGNTESDPTDGREIAIAFQKCADDIEQLHKIEIHLRRAYNRTWDRLEKMQKERHKLPLDESLKRSQIWLTSEAQRNNRPEDIPARHPGLDEKGKFPKYPKDHPLHLLKDEEGEDEKGFRSTNPQHEDGESDWKDLTPK